MGFYWAIDPEGEENVFVTEAMRDEFVESWAPDAYPFEKELTKDQARLGELLHSTIRFYECDGWIVSVMDLFYNVVNGTIDAPEYRNGRWFLEGEPVWTANTLKDLFLKFTSSTYEQEYIDEFRVMGWDPRTIPGMTLEQIYAKAGEWFEKRWFALDCQTDLDLCWAHCPEFWETTAG